MNKNIAKCCCEVHYQDIDLIEAGETKEVKKLVENNKGKFFLSSRTRSYFPVPESTRCLPAPLPELPTYLLILPMEKFRS